MLKASVPPVCEFRRASMFDELHLAVRPVLLGNGEPLFHGIDLYVLGYECTKASPANARRMFFAQLRVTPILLLH